MSQPVFFLSAQRTYRHSIISKGLNTKKESTNLVSHVINKLYHFLCPLCSLKEEKVITSQLQEMTGTKYFILWYILKMIILKISKTIYDIRQNLLFPVSFWSQRVSWQGPVCLM